jgi:CRISPR-associated endoribonuclease Cas6
LRLVLTLRSTRSSPYDLSYHRNLQGFIYNLIRKAGYLDLHDKPGCKFFSFSNIIPPTPRIESGSRKSLVIASPYGALIEALNAEVERLLGVEVKIGNMRFRLDESALFEARLPDDFSGCTLTSGTPIVVRIPRHRYQEYGIEPRKDYDYAYWREHYPLVAFVRQIDENLSKKYAEFRGENGHGEPLVESLGLELIKQVAVPLPIAEAQTTVIGTLWSFRLGHLNFAKRRIAEFGLDAGFGEMNSLGFGFMNLQKGSETC